MSSMMTSILNQIKTCNYPSRKTETKCAKTQSKNKTIETKSFREGNLLNQPEGE
jgi:hypothetical protein